MGKVVYTRGGVSVYTPINAEVLFIGSIRAKPHILINGVEYKHCSKCDSWRSLGKFYVSTNKVDGLQSYCMQCSDASAMVSNLRRSKFKRKFV